MFCIMLYIVHVSGVLGYLSFAVSLILLSVMTSRSIHFTAHGVISLFIYLFLIDCFTILV